MKKESTIHLRISNIDKQRINEIAKKEQKTLSEQLREIIKLFLEKKS